MGLFQWRTQTHTLGLILPSPVRSPDMHTRCSADVCCPRIQMQIPATARGVDPCRHLARLVSGQRLAWPMGREVGVREGGNGGVSRNKAGKADRGQVTYCPQAVLREPWPRDESGKLKSGRVPAGRARRKGGLAVRPGGRVEAVPRGTHAWRGVVLSCSQLWPHRIRAPRLKRS